MTPTWPYVDEYPSGPPRATRAHRRPSRLRRSRPTPTPTAAAAAGWSLARAVAAFVDGGWLAASVLSPPERAVWLAAARAADPLTGECELGLAGLLKAMRNGSWERARAARARLVAVGLFAVLSPGGGSRPMRVRVVVPPAAPATGSLAARPHKTSAARPATTKPARVSRSAHSACDWSLFPTTGLNGR